MKIKSEIPYIVPFSIDPGINKSLDAKNVTLKRIFSSFPSFSTVKTLNLSLKLKMSNNGDPENTPKSLEESGTENPMDISDVPPDTLTADEDLIENEIDTSAPQDETKEQEVVDETEENKEPSQDEGAESASKENEYVDIIEAPDDELSVEPIEADEDEEEVEINSQKSADEVVQTAIRDDDEDEDVMEEESDTEEIHLSKEENELLSEERLDRTSPEMWEKEKSRKVDDIKPDEAPAWAKGLTQDDIDQIYKLGTLSKADVIAEVKKLYDLSYKIGVQEAKEMTRGRYLNIFSSAKKKDLPWSLVNRIIFRQNFN